MNGPRALIFEDKEIKVLMKRTVLVGNIPTSLPLAFELADQDPPVTALHPSHPTPPLPNLSPPTQKKGGGVLKKTPPPRR
jgi:hypothetical protein